MKYALRSLLKSPGFTLLAVGALALGIGANTVLFSTINTLFLRPLSYPEPDRLVSIYSVFAERGMEQTNVSWPRFRAWHDAQRSFDEIAAQAQTGFTLTGRGDPEQLRGARVTAGLFRVLGVTPLRGRLFSSAEDSPGGADVVLLGEGFWRKRFGGKPEILGQSIVLNGRPHTIIGILPALGFPYDQNQIWAPRVFDIEGLPRDVIERGTGFLNLIGRLKRGTTVAQAAQELHVLHANYAAAYPEKVDAKTNLLVVPLQEDLVGAQRPMFLTLLAAVGCVLLVACANVGNLLLARFAGRRKEIAIRSALGASRRRIVSQFLMESMLTAGIAGALGVLLAFWGVDLLARIGENFIPRAHDLHLDPRVLGFAVLLSLLTGVLLGLAPAIQASRTDAAEALKDSSRGSSESRRAGVFRASLLVAEVALSLVLLVGAALLIDSFRRLQRVDPGFKTEGVTTFFVALPATQYPTPERQALFFEQLVAKLGALPGVAAASATDGLPIVGGSARSPVVSEGQAIPPMQERPSVRRNTSAPGVFAALGIPIQQGRDFTWRDRAGAPNVALINETLAHRLFGSENPIGRRVITGIQSIPREIVGVVANHRAESLTQPPEAQMWYPSAQLDGQFMTIVVRSTRPTASLRPEIAATLHSIDASLPLGEVQSLKAQLSQAVADRRLAMLLLGGFAGLALALAGMGIYSVIAYSVSQRTNEFGIRMALGAAPTDVVQMVVREGLRLASIGLGVGLVVSLGVTRLMQKLLFEVSPTDPLILAGVAVFICAIAALACLVPARRATKVDPMIALRAE